MSKPPKKWWNDEYWRRKSLHFLNDWTNFNTIFRKDVSYNNTKSHKNPGLHPFSRRYIFAKVTGVREWGFVYKLPLASTTPQFIYRMLCYEENDRQSLSWHTYQITIFYWQPREVVKKNYFAMKKCLNGVKVFYKWPNARNKFGRVLFSGLENSIWEIFTRQWYSESRQNESSFRKSFPKAVQAENNERQTSGWKRRKKRKKNSKKIRIFQLQRRLHRICIRCSWSKWCMILQNQKENLKSHIENVIFFLTIC